MSYQIEVNLLAVLVAAIIYIVVGALWYSPFLFAKMWMDLVGKKEEDLKANAAAQGYIVSVIAALITAYVLAHMIRLVGAMTIAAGAQTGFWLWLGFVATTSATNYIFAGRPRQLYLIDNGYHLVALIIMGALLAAWR